MMFASQSIVISLLQLMFLLQKRKENDLKKKEKKRVKKKIRKKRKKKRKKLKLRNQNSQKNKRKLLNYRKIMC